jgi:hypothetical protein
MDAHEAIAGWESFYVIVGSSAAALTGLQFVVIALGADVRRLAGPAPVSAFATPTVVHFSAVLLLAAILTTPRHSAASVAACLAVVGLAGIGYTLRVVSHTRRQRGYAPVLEDWIWHVALPFLAYIALLVGGIAARTHIAEALYAVAAVALLLLYIGIHNAWDSATYLAMQPREEPAAPPARKPASDEAPPASRAAEFEG